jgi:hypothetical protein
VCLGEPGELGDLGRRPSPVQDHADFHHANFTLVRPSDPGVFS